jgi:hypothetical protein
MNDDTHDLISSARRMWKDAGPLAPSSRFAAFIECVTPRHLVLMADTDKVGRKGSMMTRCVRRIPVSEANESSLRDLIDALYRSVSSSVVAADSIGVKF